MEFNENSNRKVINVDVDGILTNGEKFWDTEPSPNLEVISLTRDLYKKETSLSSIPRDYGDVHRKLLHG